MGLLSNAETGFLRRHRVGRLATASTSGRPHVVPTGYHFDAGQGTIQIGAHALEGRGQERLYVRHLRANPQAAYVVDDLQTEPAWTPQGVTVKGTVRFHTEGGERLGPGFGPNWIEIVPDWVSSWGIDTHPLHPATPRKA